MIALANVGGIKLALFRNPWGKNVAGCDQPNAYGGGGEWRGKWSDCDANTWNSNPQVLQSVVVGLRAYVRVCVCIRL